MNYKIYSIVNDTLNSKLDIAALHSQIKANSTLGPQFDGINTEQGSDSFTCVFISNLTQQMETELNTVVANHDGEPLPTTPTQVEVDSAAPFAAKTIRINGVIKKLFKRVHGANATIDAGQTSSIDFVVPYAWAKFTGAEINGCSLKDTLDFTVHDTTNNDISGLDPQVYGANVLLNQFGFDVEMPEGPYQNTSDYDADLYQNMIIRCTYTNNSQSSKYISLNFWLHEVKD